MDTETRAAAPLAASSAIEEPLLKRLTPLRHIPKIFNAVRMWRNW